MTLNIYTKIHKWCEFSPTSDTKFSVKIIVVHSFGNGVSIPKGIGDWPRIKMYYKAWLEDLDCHCLSKDSSGGWVL